MPARASLGVGVGVATAAALALAGPGAVTSRGVPGWVRTAKPWELREVGPRERSIVVTFDEGGCEGNPVASATETARSVAVVLTVETPAPGTNPKCPLFLRVGATAAAPLERPLAGRRILGTWASGQAAFEQAGTRTIATVPRVIGMAPGDARRLVAGWRWATSSHWRARTRLTRVRGGLPRVLRQEPSPGRHEITGRVVSLLVGAPGRRARGG